jgi:hypothetical protein
MILPRFTWASALALTALCLSGCNAPSAARTQLYVNQATGNDGNPGTLGSPKLTLLAAATAASTSAAGGADPTVCIVGDYVPPATVTFGAGQSGTLAHPVWFGTADCGTALGQLVGATLTHTILQGAGQTYYANVGTSPKLRHAWTGDGKSLELAKYQPYTTPGLANVIASWNEGTASVNAVTAAGSAVLHFASVPAFITVGMTANDQTATTAIPAGTTVLSKTSTTVTLSANVAGAGVGAADSFSFSARKLTLPIAGLMAAGSPLAYAEVCAPLAWNVTCLPNLTLADNGDGTVSATPQDPARTLEFCKGLGGSNNQNPCSATITNMPFAIGPYHDVGQHYFLKSSCAYLTYAGSFCFDQALGYLNLYQPAGTTTLAQVQALGVYVANGVATGLALDGASNIRWSVPVKFFDWNTPSTNGYVGYAPGTYLTLSGVTYGFGTVPGAVTVKNSTNISFYRVAFTGLGGQGIQIGCGAKQISIDESLFSNIASTAIQAHCLDFAVTSTPAPSQIDQIEIGNTVIRDIGHEYSGVGVFCGTVSRCDVNHVDISRVATGCVYFGWGAAFTPFYYSDQRFHHSRAQNCPDLNIDVAGLYANGNLTGAAPTNTNAPDDVNRPAFMVYANFFAHMHPSGWDNPGQGLTAAIYFDLGSYNNIATGNYIYDAQAAFNMNCVKYNSLRGNFAVAVDFYISVSYSVCNISSNATVNAVTSAGSAVLNFASVPAFVTVGIAVADLTASTVIPAGTTVLSKTATTVTLSANVTGAGVGAADSIVFSALYRPAYNLTDNFHWSGGGVDYDGATVGPMNVQFPYPSLASVFVAIGPPPTYAFLGNLDATNSTAFAGWGRVGVNSDAARLWGAYLD